MSRDGQIFWSSDCETFNADSLAELIESDDDLEAGDLVSYGEAEDVGTDFVSEEDVIELIADRAYDYGGEAAEDFPDVSDEAARELAAFLAAWQAKHCKPNFYRIRNVKHYTITEADINEARRSPTQ